MNRPPRQRVALLHAEAAQRSLRDAERNHEITNKWTRRSTAEPLPFPARCPSVW